MRKKTGDRWTHRPDGTEAVYYDLRDWPKKRVVWEFVRRNVTYQKACERAVIDQRTGEIDGPPSEYGSNVPLRDLVDYTRDWESAARLLHFAIPKTGMNDAEEADSEPRRLLNVTLNIHKLVLKPWMLEIRLTEIKKIAQKKMRRYAREAGREIVIPRFHPKAVARSLRYLDMVHGGMSTRDIKAAFYANRSQDDQDRMLDKDKKRALLYRKGHVAFLLLEELARGARSVFPTGKSAELRAGRDA